MAGIDATPQTLLAIVNKKAGMAPDSPQSDLVLYAITSTIYSDF
jgi:hypothetical protein